MDTAVPFAAEHGRTLVGLARQAIEAGPGESVAPPEPGRYAQPLQSPGASFVTLTAGGRLRGCCGHLEPTGPLVLDVWQAARASAYADPRFPPVTPSEAGRLALEIAILGASEPITVMSEAELLSQLRPGKDGLIVSFAARRATFLPKVWESLPDPAAFVRELRRKAGLPADFWSEELRWLRYRVDTFSDSA